MYFTVKGTMLYHRRGHHRIWQAPTLLSGRDWCAEAVLWTEWITRGKMMAQSECELAGLDAKKFENTLLMDCIDVNFPKCYGATFINVLNDSVSNGKPLTDLHSNL